MKKVTIVVPTYWTLPSTKKSLNTVFDHPTPLDFNGTLERTLESFKKIKYPNFDILVITVATHEKISFEVEKKVQKIISKFERDLKIKQFSYSNLPKLKEKITKLGHTKILKEINLNNYNNIRNLQLLIPYMEGSEVVVGIDDDEVIPNEDYLFKATKYIGTLYNNEVVAGVAGYYLDENSNHRLSFEDKNTNNIFDNKTKLMDKTYELLDKKAGNLVKTSVVFGGNMVLHKDTIEKVSFDPYNTRGEDIDYLINAKMEGLNFFLDKSLNIIHLPPKYSKDNKINVSKLKQDILRFFYEKEKIKYSKNIKGLKFINIEELKPYPGEFFEEKVFKDAEEKLLSILERKEVNEFINYAKTRAKKLSPKYFDFRLLWKNLFKDLKKVGLK